MKHFLLRYRRSSGEILSLVEFGSDMKAATAERYEAERRARTDPDLEVVVLSAASRAALVETHVRYFKTSPEIARDIDTAAVA